MTVEELMQETSLDKIIPPSSFSAEFDGDKLEYEERVEIPEESDPIEFVDRTHQDLRHMWDKRDRSPEFEWWFSGEDRAEDEVTFNIVYDFGAGLSIEVVALELQLISLGEVRI